jgi:hypothetical protein
MFSLAVKTAKLGLMACVITIILLLFLLLQAVQLQPLNVFAFLTIFFLFMPVLHAVLPIIYFYGIHIIFNIILVWGLPNYLIAMGFHSYTFFTILSSGILCTCPSQPNPCDLMQFIIVLFPISLFNSSFVLILHVPSPSLVGPKILRLLLLLLVRLLLLLLFRKLYSLKRVHKQEQKPKKEKRTYFVKNML